MADTITQKDAQILMNLLDIATEQQWPRIAQDIRQQWQVEDVLSAWKRLELIAGTSGSVPTEDDFDVESIA